DAGHHGIRHHAARHHQPSGRCRAGAGPDGRWRDRCAVRGARRAEDSRRTPAAVAWAPDSRGRNPLRDRTGDPARRSLHHPGNRRHRMIARVSFAALGVALLLSTTCAVPTRAERLIVSVSNHRVTVTPNYYGEKLVVLGVSEKECST